MAKQPKRVSAKELREYFTQATVRALRVRKVLKESAKRGSQMYQQAFSETDTNKKIIQLLDLALYLDSVIQVCGEALN